MRTIHIRGEPYVEMPMLARDFTKQHGLHSECASCAFLTRKSETHWDCGDIVNTPSCGGVVFVHPDKVQEHETYLKLQEMGL